MFFLIKLIKKNCIEKLDDIKVIIEHFAFDLECPKKNFLIVIGIKTLVLWIFFVHICIFYNFYKLSAQVQN